MKHNGWAYIEHMIEDCMDIANAIKTINSVDEFKQNRIVHKAVIYSILNLGELCKALSESDKEMHPQVPWNRIIGFRNRSSHGYHHLDLDIVYEIATMYIPIVYEALQQQL